MAEEKDFEVPEYLRELQKEGADRRRGLDAFRMGVDLVGVEPA